MHFQPYTSEALKTVNVQGKIVSCFLEDKIDSNIDHKTVKSFGEEWTKFSSFSSEEISKIGDQYFDLIDKDILDVNTTVLDVGCGSGRWSKYLSNKVKSIDAIDPSDAVYSAAKLLSESQNIRITQTSIDHLPFNTHSFDFVFSLGVLHHIPDTQKAMKDVVKMLKPNGHFLFYLYYNLDNRGLLYKSLFYFSNLLRLLISKLPAVLKKIICDILAVIVYLPFVLFSKLIKFLGFEFYRKIPLSYYVDKSFYIIRNDSLDRFGTSLEKRFSKKQITQMMKDCGLIDIRFSPNMPYWHAIGKKANEI